MIQKFAEVGFCYLFWTIKEQIPQSADENRREVIVANMAAALLASFWRLLLYENYKLSGQLNQFPNSCSILFASIVGAIVRLIIKAKQLVHSEAKFDGVLRFAYSLVDSKVFTYPRSLSSTPNSPILQALLLYFWKLNCFFQNRITFFNFEM